MFALARYYIKTSFLFLVAGMGAGLWALVARDLYGAPLPYRFASAHGHLLLVGFLVMLVMGVSVWMFPRPVRGDVRYRESVAAGVFWLMTASVILRFLAEAALAFGGADSLRWASAAGGLGEFAGASLFVYNLWPRIRPALRP
jgi:heme/copper-type cytochrome/quinol oxidase subunit 1